jgi:NOL1/NOP2/fmu family ribosome biogenesis protein
MKKSKHSIVLILTGLLFGTYIMAQETVIIQGKVINSQTNQPVAEALVSAPGVSPVETNSSGEFSLIIIVSEAFKIEVSKEGYKKYEAIKMPAKKIELSIPLEPEQENISIEMTEFKSNNYIVGRVTGLSEDKYQDCKILVYVKTDKWYIHPHADNTAGKGFALINQDGTWKISTVWRGYQSSQVAFVLVDRNYAPPSPIEGNIYGAVEAIEISVIDSPKGI